MDKYNNFLQKKIYTAIPSGFDISLEKLNPLLFNWQKVLTKWALARGRAALFEDCGLGKTCQLLEWSKQIHKKEKQPILILAPLAVSEQTQREGEKFKIDVNICVNDIRQTNTLNIKQARDKEDERHICPLQLDVIARCLELWSNPGDVIFSPFMGIGSEGYGSLRLDRKFIGVELKDSYYKIAIKNLKSVKNQLKPFEI